jgi:probable HAF family extracellular repeat protein
MSTNNLRCDLAAVLLFAGSLLSCVDASAQSGTYNFVNIDYPGALFSAPNGINDSGQIVGYWEDASGNIHGYLYNNGVFTSLDYPAAASTEAVGINNSGVISGWYVTTDDVPQGFTYSEGTFTSFTYPGSSRTNAKGINNHGEVVGFYGTTYSFVDSDGAFTSFGYPGADVSYAFGINDTGQIAGYYLPDSGSPVAFFYDGQSTFTSIQYPDSTETFAYGINNSNVVVGKSANSGTLLGFLWQNGQFTVVGPPASSPLPFGINNHGQIVGIYFPGGEGHGFLGTPAGSPALQFVPVTPCRLVDTRITGGPIQGGGSRNFSVPQLGGCDISSSAAAFSLNVTAVPHGPLGYLTIWPAGESQPTTSLLNSTDGRTKANAAIVPAGNSGAVSIFVSNTSDVVLDINGYFTAASGSTLAFYPLAPCRVLDTRNPNGTLGGPFLTGGQERDFPVLSSNCNIPSSAQAYSMNFTVVPYNGEPMGYLTVWPQGSLQPVVSTLNNRTATNVANAAIVPAGTGGGIAAYPSGNTQLVADIDGYFAAPGSGGLSLYTEAPCRVLDTRSGNGDFRGELTVNVAGSACAPSDSAQAYVFNATVVPPGALGYLTLWPDGENQPQVSTLNALDGLITSNMAIVPTTNGSIDAYASSLTQLILDISSYFAP